MQSLTDSPARDTKHQRGDASRVTVCTGPANGRIAVGVAASVLAVAVLVMVSVDLSLAGRSWDHVHVEQLFASTVASCVSFAVTIGGIVMLRGFDSVPPRSRVDVFHRVAINSMLLVLAIVTAMNAATHVSAVTAQKYVAVVDVYSLVTIDLIVAVGISVLIVTPVTSLHHAIHFEHDVDRFV
jgi:hypothetical protein